MLPAGHNKTRCAEMVTRDGGQPGPVSHVHPRGEGCILVRNGDMVKWDNMEGDEVRVLLKFLESKAKEIASFLWCVFYGNDKHRKRHATKKEHTPPRMSTVFD